MSGPARVKEWMEVTCFHVRMLLYIIEGILNGWLFLFTIVWLRTLRSRFLVIQRLLRSLFLLCLQMWQTGGDVGFPTV